MSIENKKQPPDAEPEWRPSRLGSYYKRFTNRDPELDHERLCQDINAAIDAVRDACANLNALAAAKREEVYEQQLAAEYKRGYKQCEADSDAQLQRVIDRLENAEKYGYQRGVRDCSERLVEFHGDQNLSKEG